MSEFQSYIPFITNASGLFQHFVSTMINSVPGLLLFLLSIVLVVFAVQHQRSQDGRHRLFYVWAFCFMIVSVCVHRLLHVDLILAGIGYLVMGLAGLGLAVWFVERFFPMPYHR